MKTNTQQSIELARDTTASRPTDTARVAWPAWLLALAVGLVALLPRVTGLADFVTTDEVYNWLPRIGRFSAAIAEGRWGDTVLTGHPGITLLWFGEIGLALERTRLSPEAIAALTSVQHLAWLRLPSAIFEAISVPIGYLLLRRLVAPTIAAIAALLWATAPYLIAHSRFYHLDALLTTFVTLAVLCTLIACRAPHRRRWVVAAGVCAGLALLTKGPALILLPTIGLLLFWQLPAPSLLARLRSSIGLYALWLAVAAAVFVIVWPAMWVDPLHAVRSFLGVIVQNGGRPNGAGQFFLGHAIDDPGLLFYPLADLFRTTPAMLIGLIGLALAFRRQTPRDERRRWTDTQHTLFALTAFILFWTLVMTIGPKKFDRYTLPTWPALQVLAAAGWDGWLWGLRALLDRTKVLRERGERAIAGTLLVALLVAEGWGIVFYHPYYLSYYNPLLGGGEAAQRTFLIGWGEGMDQVGAYLSAQPDIMSGQVLSALPRTLDPFVTVPVRDVLDIDRGAANYAVVYLESIQREDNAAIYARIRQTAPLHRVTIHGIDYAEIYQLPKPFEHAIGAQFGDALLLRGVTITPEPGRLVVTPSWDVRAQPAADYQVFLHVIDSAGNMIARIDIPTGGGEAQPTSTWQAGRQIAVPLPIPLPEQVPAGDYRITLGLYDIQNGQRLPISGAEAADPALDGPNALLLDTVALP